MSEKENKKQFPIKSVGFAVLLMLGGAIFASSIPYLLTAMGIFVGLIGILVLFKTGYDHFKNKSNDEDANAEYYTCQKCGENEKNKKNEESFPIKSVGLAVLLLVAGAIFASSIPYLVTAVGIGIIGIGISTLLKSGYDYFIKKPENEVGADQSSEGCYQMPATMPSSVAAEGLTTGASANLHDEY